MNGDYEAFSERDGNLNGPTFKQLFKVNRDGGRRDRTGDESCSGHPHYIVLKVWLHIQLTGLAWCEP